MSTLRVLLDDAPTMAREDAWALFDEHDQLVHAGIGPPRTWPSADAREAVIAAASVRLIALRLPPMSAERIPAAAAFALEDQIAGPADEQHIAVITEQADGTVVAAVATRGLVAALHGEFVRVVAEPTLAPLPAAGRWCWYGSGTGGAFVRKSDGTAFATSTPRSHLPSELALTLAHAMRGGTAPNAIDVAFAIDDEQLHAWSTQSNLEFLRVEPWTWDQDGGAIASAPDLLQGEFSRETRHAPRRFARTFALALGVACVAVALHIAATLTHWASLRIAQWQTERAIVAASKASGAGDTADSAMAAAAIARMYREARHRAGLTVSADVLPLLARAAPALAALPPGAVKTATYTDGQWLLDLAKLDAAAISRLEHRLGTSGLGTIAATTGSGTRIRITLAPGMERP